MQYMGPEVVYEDVIQPEANYYTMYDILSTFDGILVIVRHFAIMCMRVTPSKACAQVHSAVQYIQLASYGLS